MESPGLCASFPADRKVCCRPNPTPDPLLRRLTETIGPNKHAGYVAWKATMKMRRKLFEANCVSMSLIAHLHVQGDVQVLEVREQKRWCPEELLSQQHRVFRV